ncbi:Hypothetical protein PBC10988_8850 [Planctomycetales bacterium 10988]|nr:Hypothetical protein PBC10988_8850 [Planctomycetales bacterium 10988]
MQERYFEQPYEFISPYRRTFWIRLFTPIIRWKLKDEFQIHHLEYRGLEHLESLIEKDAGILLTPNHNRLADSPVLGILGLRVDRYLHWVASYHLFKQSRFRKWFLKRMGAFSILREGTDREAIKACGEILQTQDRLLNIFPEGTWFRQNDRLGPLQDGVAFIVRQTLRKAERPIYIVPIAIKYWVLKDPTEEINQRLSKLERGLHWEPKTYLDPVDRIGRICNAYLSVKEIETFGKAHSGSQDLRIEQLVQKKLFEIEKRYYGEVGDGAYLARVRRLRQKLVKMLWDANLERAEKSRAKADLNDLLFCELAAAHSEAYLIENPTYERIVEAVLRLEESLSDTEEPIVPMGAVVAIGKPIRPEEFPPAGRKERKLGDPLMKELRFQMEKLLQETVEAGPPESWNCPKPRIIPARPDREGTDIDSDIDGAIYDPATSS